MGTFQKTIVADGQAIADADSSVTINLPRSNRISEVGWMLRGTGGSGTPACEALITKAEIIADGVSHIIDASNVQLRDIMQMRQKGQRNEIVNATGAATRVNTSVWMGRYKHDPLMMIPAYLFSTLQLKLTFGTLIATTAFATGTVKLDVFCDELVVDEDDPADEEMFLQKIAEVVTFTAATSGDKKIELQRGHLIAALYIRAAGTDGTTVSKFSVKLNNGALIPISETWLKSQADDIVEYALSGGSKIANVTLIDFDNPATEQIIDEVIDTGIDSGVLAADLVVSQGAAQACSVVQLTYVPIEEL